MGIWIWKRRKENGNQKRKRKEKEFRHRLGRGAKFGPINPAAPAHMRIGFPSPQSLARGAVGQSVLARSPGWWLSASGPSLAWSSSSRESRFVGELVNLVGFAGQIGRLPTCSLLSPTVSMHGAHACVARGSYMLARCCSRERERERGRCVVTREGERTSCLLAAAILAGRLALAGGRVVRIRHRWRPSFQSSTGSPVRIFLRVLYSRTLCLVYCGRCHLFVVGSVHCGAITPGFGRQTECEPFTC
jgi:hypothetical protein